uniref:Histidine-containing phosphotransfer protein n=1 Tax=Ananas comosus var. bracteatus TaxID=296719 RepID=A0A6V7NPE6_ANACO|nr:unnamed protein product [Ananas comosus var. bracteatus]
MEVSRLQRRYVDFTSALYHEGFLDAQFTELQHLQDENNPNFVSEVVSLFLRTLRGFSTNSAGPWISRLWISGRLMHMSTSLREAVPALVLKGLKMSVLLFEVAQVRQECYLVKNKLDALFRLEQQILAAGGPCQ